MKPCDCKDHQDTLKLSEVGLCHNDESIFVTPGYVTLKFGHTTITVSMHRFKQFAEWYLADQSLIMFRGDCDRLSLPEGTAVRERLSIIGGYDEIQR